jgi:hypothetical protein
VKTSSSISHSVTGPQSEFRITYGTGGIKSPASLRIVSLAKFHQLLLTKHEAETEALHELWQPYTSTTRQERFLQHQKIESTFPFVVPGVTFDKEASLADEDDYHAGWQQMSGLVTLTFRYAAAKGNEDRTTKRRLQLHKQLLAVPLLGPSIVLMPKAPGDCLVHVLLAVGAMSEYRKRVHTITSYLQAVAPALHKKLAITAPLANERFSVGFDPLVYFQPVPKGGYAIFPTEQARQVTQEANRKKMQEPTRQRKRVRSR